MSEQGSHGFLAAEGVDDWVVLHGGAIAVFRVASLSEAARLAEAIVKAPGTLADRAGNRVCVCAWPDGGALRPGAATVE